MNTREIPPALLDRVIELAREAYQQMPLEQQEEIHRKQAESYGAHAAQRGERQAVAVLPSTFQDRVVEVFDDICRDDPTDLDERACRLFEEAAETVQAVGMTREAAHALVDYTFGRPPGEPGQEVGGLMVSIAGLCGQVGLKLDMAECAERELARCSTPEVRAKIRGKRSRRHGRGPLPGTTEADVVPESSSGRPRAAFDFRYTD